VEEHLGRRRWRRRPDSDGGWSEGARGHSFFSRRGAIEWVAHAVAPWRIRRGRRCDGPRLRSPACRCRGLRVAAARARSRPEGRGRCARRPERLMKQLFTRLDSECSSANSRACHATVPQTGSQADAGATSGREPSPWMKRAHPPQAHLTPPSVAFRRRAVEPPVTTAAIPCRLPTAFFGRIRG
jgi:hypothetical protein